MGLVFVFGFGYGRWYSTKPAANKSERKILYYVDAMHPWYKSDKPGIAPDCGMKLEPVYAEGSGAADEPCAGTEAVAGTPRNSSILIGVRYGQAEWSAAGDTMRAAGRVVPDETLLTRVQARTDGWITEVSGGFHGQVHHEGATAAHPLQSRTARRAAGVSAGAEGADDHAAQFDAGIDGEQRRAGGGRRGGG